MKALTMDMTAEAVRAVKNPIRNMHTLAGGIGKATLTPIQIKRLRENMKREKIARREKEEWERFIRKTRPSK